MAKETKRCPAPEKSILAKYKVVEVRLTFPGAPLKCFTYQVPRIWDIKVNDYILVDTRSHGLVAAKVVETPKNVDLSRLLKSACAVAKLWYK